MKTERGQVYLCEKCGNQVNVLQGGGPVPHCCNQQMTLLAENTTDAAQEKHVPVVEKAEGGFKVAIGSTLHPMESEHLIEWIELVADGRSYFRFLQSSESPEAFFAIAAENATARAYCNLHGLWKG